MPDNILSMAITFFHPWKDQRTTRTFRLRNLPETTLEKQVIWAESLLDQVVEELYYISGGQGILEGRIKVDDRIQARRSFFEKYPPTKETFVFLDHVLAIKFAYILQSPKADGTYSRRSGIKTLNIPSLIVNPLQMPGTTRANLTDPVFQRFCSRFAEDGHICLLTRYESWGNVQSAAHKMLPSVTKTNRRKVAANPKTSKGSEGKGEHIYLIHMYGNIYKIGRSRKPKQRLKALQTSNPYPLSLVHSFKADQADRAEMKLHESLTEAQQEGEWFVLTTAQKEALCRIETYKAGKFYADGEELDLSALLKSTMT